MHTLQWFDGHLDLAYIALECRDLGKPPLLAGGPHQPAAVTFPALAAAGVTRVFSTIFVAREAPDHHGPAAYRTFDEAHAAGSLQLRLHDSWEAAGWIRRHPSSGLPPEPPETSISPPACGPPIQVTIAIEGAACLRTPEDLHLFHRGGARMISLTWNEGSPYAGGDRTGEDLTPAGIALIQHINSLGMIHDVSHLSERAFWSLLEHARGPIVASHSNCRSLMPGSPYPERHLSDAQIKALTQRGGGGGIIGINLFARFLIPPDELTKRRATLADVLNHIQHIEQIAGTRACLALGSDMDGGFSTEFLPEDLQGPQDFHKLAEALSLANWSDTDIQTFANRWSSLF